MDNLAKKRLVLFLALTVLVGTVNGRRKFKQIIKSVPKKLGSVIESISDNTIGKLPFFKVSTDISKQTNQIGNEITNTLEEGRNVAHDLADDASNTLGKMDTVLEDISSFVAHEFQLIKIIILLIIAFISWKICKDFDYEMSLLRLCLNLVMAVCIFGSTLLVLDAVLIPVVSTVTGMLPNLLDN